MNTTNKVLVAVLALQVVLAVAFLGRGDTTSVAAPEPVLKDFAADKVERIEIFKGADGITGAEATAGVMPELVMAKQDGQWVVATHHNYPVGMAKLDTFFGKLTGLQTRGAIADSQARQLQLRVAPDRYVRKVVLHRQGGAPLTLYIGQPAGARTTAVRMDGSDAIHAVTGFSPSSTPTSVVGWIDTTYFEVEERQVEKLTVKNAAGTFAFARDGLGGWKIAEGVEGATLNPENTAVDKAAVDSLLRQVALLKLIEPVDPATVTGSPLATVIVELMSTPAPGEDGASVPGQQFTFLIGPERNGRYIVRRTDQSTAVEISMNKLDPLINARVDTVFKSAPAPAVPASSPPK